MSIDRSAYQTRARTMPDHLANMDKLTPGSLRGAKAAVVTIKEVAQVDARRGNNPRTGEPAYEPAIVLVYEEFPNRIHWLNKMGVNILCDVFSEDETQWIGNRIPVQVKEGVKNPSKGTKDDMLWVANADEWERLFDEDEKYRASFAGAREAATESVAAAPSPAAAAAREASLKRRKPRLTE